MAEDDSIRRNIFEDNVVQEDEEKTVPLTLEGKVVGEAQVRVTDSGIHVMFANVTDPAAKKLLTGFNEDLSYIHNHSTKDSPNAR